MPVVPCSPGKTRLPEQAGDLARSNGKYLAQPRGLSWMASNFGDQGPVAAHDIPDFDNGIQTGFNVLLKVPWAELAWSSSLGRAILGTNPLSFPCA